MNFLAEEAVAPFPAIFRTRADTSDIGPELAGDLEEHSCLGASYRWSCPVRRGDRKQHLIGIIGKIDVMGDAGAKARATRVILRNS